MIHLFDPAIRLMHRLRYPQKFLLVGLLLLLPLILVMSQYLAGINHDINFAKLERDGLVYNAPVVDLLQVVQRHAALSSIYAVNQDAAIRELLEAEEQAAAELIVQIDEVNARLGEKFQVSRDWAAFKTGWAALQADATSLDAETSASRHLEMNQALLQLITEVGNNSNLILDPDLDAYYLMETVITKAPLTAEYLSQVRMYGSIAAAEGTLSPENRTRLVILSGLAQSTLDANLVGFGYSFGYNPDLEGELDPAITTHQAASAQMTSILDQQLAINSTDTTLTVDPAAYYADMTDVTDETFAFYDVISPKLDELLQIRIDGFAMQRNLVVAFALSALLLTIYLFIAFYLAVKQTIAHLDQASQRMIKREMSGAVVLESQDELAQVAVSFNNIAGELITARDQAVEASRAKSTFLANMSHELRTPLNAILGFAQLLERDSKLNASQKENVAVIGRSGEHLLALINNVLEMSKIEAGRISLDERGFDLHRMLKGLQEMMEVRAHSKQLNMLFEIEADMPRFVRADENKLRQILINLVGNAIKFTNEGGIALRVGKKEDANGFRLAFEVEDTGEGIAPEDMGKLFEAFVQTETGKKSKQDGTGLGLPLSRQFVQMMGGDITVASHPGRGSIFKFDVPSAPVEADDIEVVQKSRRAIGIVPGQVAHRILIVDDKFENRHLLGKLLKSVGFDVREVENGQEAIDTWEQWEPQLIWMDMRMPVMDGYEATKRIKATIKGQATVIIALTASVFEHERSIILSTGCDGFVAKPFRESEIFDTMSKHLGIQFIYEDQQDEASPLTQEKPVVSGAALAAQSPAWVASLQEAAIQGDTEAVQGLIQQLDAVHKTLGDGLNDMIKNYRFDLILEMVEQAGVTS